MVTPENVITISLAEVEQLFNTMDPSPFHERDLDDKAEQYIVGYAREMPRGQPFRLIVNVPQIELTTPQPPRMCPKRSAVTLATEPCNLARTLMNSCASAGGP